MTSLPILVAALLGGIPLEVSNEPDGMEILNVQTPPEHECHVRMVVRAGATHDPVKMSGLSHLIEHVVLARHVSWNSNVQLNAATFSDATVFSASADGESCEEQLESLLRFVSDPNLLMEQLNRERSVIDHEERFRTGLRRGPALDSLLSSSSVEAVLGTGLTRAAITAEAAQQFYLRHYHPANMTLVVVSPLSMAAIRGAIDRGFRLPPSRPDERAERRVPSLSLPIQGPSLTRGSVTTALRLPGPKGCALLGELIELRLLNQARDEIVSTSTECLLRAGAHWLVVSSSGSDIDREKVAQQTWKLLTGKKVAPLTRAERGVLERRCACTRKGLSSAIKADELAEDLSQYARWYPGEAIAAFLKPSPPGLDAEFIDVRDLASALVPRNTVIWGYQPDDDAEAAGVP